MIEIVLGIWFGSFILSFLVIYFHHKMVLRKFSDSRIDLLNRNISTVGFYWSIAEADFKSLENLSLAEARDLDKSRALKHVWLLSPLSLLSIVGLILIGAFVVGSHFVGKSRKEQLVFQSELVNSDKLSKESIAKLFEEFNQINW